MCITAVLLVAEPSSRSQKEQGQTKGLFSFRAKIVASVVCCLTVVWTQDFTICFNLARLKNDCKMEVKLRLNKDGDFLEIATLNESHNHECDEVCST